MPPVSAEMASLLTPGAFGGADAGPPSILAPSQNAPSILAPSQKAQPPSILNQGPPSILAPAPTGPSKPPAPKSAQRKKKPQKAKQPDPERTTVPVGDAVAPEPAMARKDKQQKKKDKKQPPKKEPKKKASPKSEEQKEAVEPSSPPHYAFSAFQISPEPSSLPKPSFSFGKKKT